MKGNTCNDNAKELLLLFVVDKMGSMLKVTVKNILRFEKLPIKRVSDSELNLNIFRRSNMF